MAQRRQLVYVKKECTAALYASLPIKHRNRILLYRKKALVECAAFHAFLSVITEKRERFCFINYPCEFRVAGYSMPCIPLLGFKLDLFSKVTRNMSFEFFQYFYNSFPSNRMHHFYNGKI